MRDFRMEMGDGSYTINARGGLHVENAVIFRKNFEGRPNKFGNTTKGFALVLPEDIGAELAERGWNVKTTVGDDPLPVIDVVVNFESKYPPDIRMWCIGSSGREIPITITPENSKKLDEAFLEKICLEISPSKTMKGYCNTFYCTRRNNAPRFSMYDTGDDIDFPIPDDDLPIG